MRRNYVTLKKKSVPINHYQQHADRSTHCSTVWIFHLSLLLITCSDKAEQWALIGVLRWQFCGERHASLCIPPEGAPTLLAGRGIRLSAITPPLPRKNSRLPVHLCKWQHAVSVPLRTGMWNSAYHLVSRSWWGSLWRDDGMKVGRFREELCQGEEWKPQGIMGQIQAGAGNEEGTKTCTTIVYDRALSVITTVRNLFLFKTNSGADRQRGKKSFGRCRWTINSVNQKSNNTEAFLGQRCSLKLPTWCFLSIIIKGGWLQITFAIGASFS